jgi:hypothetical protein
VTGGIDLQWGKAELLECGTDSTGSKRNGKSDEKIWEARPKPYPGESLDHPSCTKHHLLITISSVL